MNSPDVAVASATSAHRSVSMGAMHAKLIGMNIASAYPADMQFRVNVIIRSQHLRTTQDTNTCGLWHQKCV